MIAGGDLSNELVRHFLIECTPKGVRLKGCPNEPYFGEICVAIHLQVQKAALCCPLWVDRA